jgi:Protein of unknown function (DUF3052)
MPVGLVKRKRSEQSMAGYSGTPLARKLGIKTGAVILTVNAPSHYAALLDPLPEGTTIVQSTTERPDLVHIFTTKRAELADALETYKSSIKQDGAIWISWPKKASRVASEVTEDTVREVALPLGLVDIKVCAVDEVWSGLKLVIRREHRKK